MRALVVASVTVLVSVVPAGADGAREAFPGQNGLIVFASDRAVPQEAEIYAVAIDGRAPWNLTRSEGWDSRPLPSPDGRRIVFRAGIGSGGRSGLFVMGADGTGRRFLAAVENASWSPDSRYVAAEDGLGRVIVVDVETGAGRTLVEGNLPAWSPDGGLIAFLRGPRLFVVEAAGGSARPLAPGVVFGGVLVHPPAWSSDGTRLAFAGGEDDGNGIASLPEIYVVRVADGSATRITKGVGAKTGPRWSPDGKTIVFAEHQRAEPKSELVIVAADGSDRRLLTRNGPSTYDMYPAWSPDGSWVAFFRGPNDGIAIDVFAVRRDGTGLRRLTQRRSMLPVYEGPAWLRDGLTVLYARGSSDRDLELYSIRPDGAGLRRLTDNLVRDSQPAWSPDGSRIAFVRTFLSGRRGREHANEEVHVMRADGTGVRRLTHHRLEDLHPSWSPDGNRIVFVRRAEPQALTAIYTIRPDGTGLRRLAARPDAFYSSPVWSPDGRRIAFTGGNGLGEGGALHVMNADGSRVRRLPDVAEITVGPRWSPDGRLLAVFGVTSCGRGCERTGIYVLRSDGRNVRKVADARPGLAWSPDGKTLVLVSGPLVALDLHSRTTRQLVRGNASHESPDWQPRCTGSGSKRADRLAGSAEAELLCGLDGNDLIRGGRGRDRLFGGDGHDRIESRDGEFDVVGCGQGRDTVLADRRDLLGEDCEDVIR